MQKPKISIIGTGYVGLGTAVSFAVKGFKVIALDSDTEKVKKITQGIPPFHEPDLPEMLQVSIKNGSLRCNSEIVKTILETDVTFVAVGTPSQNDGSIDLRFIEAVSRDIGKALNQKNQYHVVVIKSTITPGTTQNLIKPLLEKESQKKCGIDFGLCMNPEFLRQGSAFYDTFHADRIVIGEYDERSGEALENIYKEFYGETPPPIIRTTLSTAELIKYASNSMLATKISFINTIANICEKIPQADVKVVAQAMGLDKRIGSQFLDAGLGYGGSCFPKDVRALIACSKAFNYTPELLESVENINKTQPLKAVDKCKEQLGNLKDKKIAILGLAFKPNTDDMREARVIPIINQLIKEGANISAYDPVATSTAKTIFKDKIQYAPSAIDCLKNADCAILVTEWPQFKKLTPEHFINNMKQPILIDGRRIYTPEDFKNKMKYITIGLGNEK
ncbi:MAG TPA: UDP-glucose/GDP-mannose dehydrogenase family protein [Candidatus Acidoferrales bacterium]|nr:UDP-glucose/GDP-mannose dehydrogenase family protein [Candidatus Acidoferrales bacterium]